MKNLCFALIKADNEAEVVKILKDNDLWADKFEFNLKRMLQMII